MGLDRRIARMAPAEETSLVFWAIKRDLKPVPSAGKFSVRQICQGGSGTGEVCFGTLPDVPRAEAESIRNKAAAIFMRLSPSTNSHFPR